MTRRTQLSRLLSAASVIGVAVLVRLLRFMGSWRGALITGFPTPIVDGLLTSMSETEHNKYAHIWCRDPIIENDCRLDDSEDRNEKMESRSLRCTD